MSTREDVPKILVSTVTVSSNLLQISPLGIPFLSMEPVHGFANRRAKHVFEGRSETRAYRLMEDCYQRRPHPAQLTINPRTRSNTLVVTYLPRFTIKSSRNGRRQCNN